MAFESSATTCFLVDAFLGFGWLKISSNSSSYQESQPYSAYKRKTATYGSVLGLRSEQVDRTGLEETPDGEDDIRFPSNLKIVEISIASRSLLRILEITYLGKRYWPCELVKKTSSADSEIGKSHSLGTHLERKDFYGVEGLQRSETDAEDEAEDVDESERCFRGTSVLRA